MSVFNILAAIYMTLVGIATVFGNGLVILTWTFYPDIRSPRNLYLVSLAVVDFITGIFHMPLLIGYGVMETWAFGEVVCVMNLFSGWVFISVSILHLITIAIDTYQVAYDGVSYIQRRTSRSVLLRIGFIWIFSIWQMAPTIFNMDHTEGKCATVSSLESRLHLCFGAYYFPVIIISVVYLDIYKEIRRLLGNRGKVPEDISSDTQMTNVSTESGSIIKKVEVDEESHKKNVVDKEQRAARTLGVIIGAFVLSWAPFFIMYPIIVMLPEGTIVPPEIYALVLIVGFSNSAMNPVIYTFYNKDFRQGFRKLLTYKRGR